MKNTCLRPKCAIGGEDSITTLADLRWKTGEQYSTCKCSCDGKVADQTCVERGPQTKKIRPVGMPSQFQSAVCAAPQCKVAAPGTNMKMVLLNNQRLTTGQLINQKRVYAECTSDQYTLRVKPGFSAPGFKNGTKGPIECVSNQNGCFEVMVNPYECVPVFCRDPCSRGLLDIEVAVPQNKSEWTYGEQVTCKCKSGLSQGPGNCRSICRNVNGNAEFVDECSCSLNGCRIDYDIPNGKQYIEDKSYKEYSTLPDDYRNEYQGIAGGHNIKWGEQRTDIRKWKIDYWRPNIPIKAPQAVPMYEHVFMTCNSGFQLVHSHSGLPVGKTELDMCARQCFRPPNASHGHKLQPILDQLACYCSPIPCQKHALSPTHHQSNFGGQTWTYQNRTLSEYWSNKIPSLFNKVCSTCKDKSYSQSFGKRDDCVECYDATLSPTDSLVNKGWNSERSCITAACPDPRGVFGARMTATPESGSLTLNLKHTLTTMDSFAPDAQKFHLYRDNTASIFFADDARDRVPTWRVDQNRVSEALGKEMNMNGDAYKMFVKNANKKGQETNMIEGSKARFTCMKGFRPYLNWENAVQSGNYGPANSNYFECTCKDGKWCCTHHCRCEKFCPGNTTCPGCN